MNKRYWLHRISHEWEVSYPLLEMGYLSIGWRKFMDTDILERIEEDSEQGFNTFMAENNETSRSRWSLWFFSQFKPGDAIVVPLFDKEFAVYSVADFAVSVRDVYELQGDSFTTKKGELVEVDPGGIRNAVRDFYYDIGFLIKVNPLKSGHIKRSFADARLVSRMKIRQTNADITDIAGSIDAALSAKTPIRIHDILTDAVAANMQQVIQSYITPDNFERVVCWYMKKKGATSVWIPAKNESGKDNGADADVIAEFEDLRVIFYIQVKKHEGTTSSWAIQQISEYTSQKKNDASDYTYIPWVITTAEFDVGTVQDARMQGVRLIGGNDFIKMLIDSGIDTIDSIFEVDSI